MVSPPPFAPHPFVPLPGLSGAHRQTLFSPALRRIAPPRLTLERLATPDGDFVRLHHHVPHGATRVALLLHGLEGSVHSPYIAGLSHVLRRRGYGVAVMEHRSCGGEMNRTRRLYHLGVTDDLAFVASTLSTRFPDAGLFIAGFSAGGNQLAKWLGDAPDAIPAAVQAAAVVSAPYDLLTTGPHLDKVLGGFYTRVFLRTLIKKAAAKEAQFPGCLDMERIRRATTFAAFDHHATAALHGFDSAEHYWATVSCGPRLPHIRVPTVLISAQDDPFNPASTLPRAVAAKSPALFPLFTERGGHVGFVGRGDDDGWRSPQYWAEAQIAAFFDAQTSPSLAG